MIWEQHLKCEYYLLVQVQIKGQASVNLVFTFVGTFKCTIAAWADFFGKIKSPDPVANT